VVPANSKTSTFLAHSAVPVVFTEEDFEQVASGNYVVKVIYLPSPQYQDLAVTGPDEVVSSRLEPGVDPITEALKRGCILVVVRLGNIDLGALNTPAMDAPNPYLPKPHAMGPPPGMMPPGMAGGQPMMPPGGPMMMPPPGMMPPGMAAGQPMMGPGGPMMMPPPGMMPPGMMPPGMMPPGMMPPGQGVPQQVPAVPTGQGGEQDQETPAAPSKGPVTQAENAASMEQAQFQAPAAPTQLAGGPSQLPPAEQTPVGAKPAAESQPVAAKPAVEQAGDKKPVEAKPAAGWRLFRRRQ
jgi:hypothetical protein